MDKQPERNQRNPHSTKRGPGRRHKDGQPHGTAPQQPKGAPEGFVQHTNPKRNAERKLVKSVGHRQVRKMNRAIAREAL